MTIHNTAYIPDPAGRGAAMAAAIQSARDVSQGGSQGAQAPKDPRIVTRGSFSDTALKSKKKRNRKVETSHELQVLLDAFFFDWFQVTLANEHGKSDCRVGSPMEADAVDQVFDWAVAENLHPLTVSGGHNGYRAALPFSEGPEACEAVLRVNSGSTSGIMPNIMLTGGHGACARLAPSLQKAFPTARLSRADAAMDVSQPGLFDELLDMSRLLAAGNGKLGGVRLIQSDQGRTFYLGSRTSTVSLRVYEKDRERAAKGIIDPEDIDPDLIRIEWTFRPQSKSKAGMSGLSPGQMIATSVWARDFMARAAKLMDLTDGVGKIAKQDVVRETREKTLEGVARHGIHQYGKAFLRLAAARMVQRDHEGRYDLAVIDPDDLHAETVVMIGDLLDVHMAEQVVMDERLAEAMDPDEWRESYVHEMQEFAARTDRQTDEAQERIRVQKAKAGL